MGRDAILGGLLGAMLAAAALAAVYHHWGYQR